MKCLNALIGSLLVVAMVVQAKGESNHLGAWQLMAGFSPSEAMKLLVKQPATPERQLAMATGLLGVYPQTSHNIDQAKILLRELVASGQRSKYQAAALYMLGRIAHIFEENHEKDAERYYHQLREQYPESQFSDNAAVKLLLIALERLSSDIETIEEQLEIEALPVPASRYARSDFHYVLAEYFMERGKLKAALDRLIMVRKLSTLKGRNKASLLVQIGRLATILDRKQIAIRAYREFQMNFPNDDRRYMVGEELKKLENGGSL